MQRRGPGDAGPAGILIATVPILIVFVVLQDFITEGLTVGALKG